MSTSLGTPPHSGPFLMPFPLLRSPIRARSASPRTSKSRFRIVPIVRSMELPCRSSAALSTYAGFTSRRLPPPPTPFLLVPPRGLLPLLSALLPAFVPCWTPDLPHMPLLGPTFITPPFTPLTSLKLHCVSSPLSPLPEIPRPPTPLTSGDCWCAASTLCVGYKALF